MILTVNDRQREYILGLHQFPCILDRDLAVNARRLADLHVFHTGSDILQVPWLLKMKSVEYILGLSGKRSGPACNKLIVETQDILLIFRLRSRFFHRLFCLRVFRHLQQFPALLLRLRLQVCVRDRGTDRIRVRVLMTNNINRTLFSHMLVSSSVFLSFCSKCENVHDLFTFHLMFVHISMLTYLYKFERESID